MLKFTLDHNCIVDLDEERPAAPYLRALLARHDAGEVSVRLVATSASERQLSGPYLENFGQFQDRLAVLGLGHLELLAPVFVIGVSYLDWGVAAGPESISLLERIHSVLFPQEAFEFQDVLAAAGPEADTQVIEQKWRRRALDVHALWCHIHYDGDIFVTRDDVFFRQSKRQPLASLGAARILRPSDAATAQ